MVIIVEDTKVSSTRSRAKLVLRINSLTPSFYRESDKKRKNRLAA